MWLGRMGGSRSPGRVLESRFIFDTRMASSVGLGVCKYTKAPMIELHIYHCIRWRSTVIISE